MPRFQTKDLSSLESFHRRSSPIEQPTCLLDGSLLIQRADRTFDLLNMKYLHTYRHALFDVSRVLLRLLYPRAFRGLGSPTNSLSRALRRMLLSMGWVEFAS